MNYYAVQFEVGKGNRTIEYYVRALTAREAAENAADLIPDRLVDDADESAKVCQIDGIPSPHHSAQSGAWIVDPPIKQGCSMRKGAPSFVNVTI